MHLLSGYSVNAILSVDLLGNNIYSELLLERAADGTAHRVRLPAGGFDDLGNSGAVGEMSSPSDDTLNKAAAL
jgi:hypothetical protein